MSEQVVSVVEGVAMDRPASVRILRVDDETVALEVPKDSGTQRVDFPATLAADVGAAVRAIVSEEEAEELELRGGGEMITVHPVTHPFGCDAMVENKARHHRGYAHQTQHVMVACELGPDVADALAALEL